MLPGGLLIAREIMNSGKVKRRVLSRRLRSFLFDCRQHGVMAYVLSQVSAFFLHSKRLPVVFFAQMVDSHVFYVQYMSLYEHVDYKIFDTRNESDREYHSMWWEIWSSLVRKLELVLVIPFPPCFSWLLFSKICHVVRWFDPGCE